VQLLPNQGLPEFWVAFYSIAILYRHGLSGDCKLCRTAKLTQIHGFLQRSKEQVVLGETELLGAACM
jgi:hypothetical protein